MITHFCVISHKPPHSYGDCLRAAIASILNAPDVTDVPHFMHHGDDERGSQEMRDWLNARGYAPFIMGVGGSTSLEEIQDVQRQVNPGIEYLLFGRADNGDDHVVVCRDGKVVHDPSVKASPIVSPCVIDGQPAAWVLMILVPIEYK